MPTVRHSKKSDDFNENPDPDFFSQKRLLLYRDIHRLHEAGYSMRGISRKLKCSRNTVIKYLNGEMENICTTTLLSGVDRYRIELIPMQSCSPEQKAKRKEILKYSYVSRKEVFRFLWMGEGLNDAQ